MNLQTVDYVKNALKTESNDFPAIKERFCDETVYNIYYELTSQLVYLNRKLDALKKFLFYGKNYNFEGFFDGLRFPDVKSYQHQYMTDQEVRLLHAALGKLTEAVEFAEGVNKVLLDNQPDFDKTNLLEELADNFWYDAIAVDALGEQSFDEPMKRNIAKLKARYGDKFNEESAINRNLTVERNILEGNV